ncbi:AAA family ATPase [Streptomyces albus]|uniref:AAA family ATPase n=1 Tax=Streptomyces albus TaxID=1888 RepID=UPI0024E100A7|nr:AAA family ATPase [Streptomyces albus]GHJ20609.1 hypothetical protein TPA0909_22230 [Streptomyces albus]
MALLERDAELAAVERGLARLCGTPGTAPRSGGLLAFTGGPGLGRTALLDETAARATARGCTVLRATGGEQEQEAGFHLVRALLHPLPPGCREPGLRAALGRHHALVAPAAGLAAPARTVPPHPHAVRRALDRLLAHLAERLAARGTPLVLLVDDVHWADPASLHWLTGLLPQVPGLPLLCALAYDPAQLRPETAHLPDAVLAGGQRPRALPALSAAAVDTLVKETFGGAEQPAFAKECWSLTGGTPLAVTRLLARAREAGLSPHRDAVGRLADLARGVEPPGFLEHLHGLGPACVRLSWAVAVLGTDTTPARAARVAGLDAQAAREATETLCRAGILHTAEDDGPAGPGTPEAGGTPRFRHPSLASEVYRSIPAATRTALHGQAAATLSLAGAAPTDCARHLLEVHPDADPAVVTDLRRAARAYATAGAPEAAHRCLGRALNEPPARRDRPALLYELAFAAFRSGTPAAAAHHLRAALAEPDCTPGLRERATRLLALARTATAQTAATAP